MQEKLENNPFSYLFRFEGRGQTLLLDFASIDLKLVSPTLDQILLPDWKASGHINRLEQTIAVQLDWEKAFNTGDSLKFGVGKLIISGQMSANKNWVFDIGDLKIIEENA